MKQQKGITLVALIITIIVMLILVAVTISIALGQNGVFTNAKKAATDTNGAIANDTNIANDVTYNNAGQEISGMNNIVNNVVYGE